MQQYTWHQGCPVTLDNLSYLHLSYWGFDSKVHQGTMIVNRKLAPEVVAIFSEIFDQKFPIEKMQPIENYQGDDERSMSDNNSSAFNCRTMTDFPDQYSIHSYGSAIDINPLINPYTNGGKIDPQEGKEFLDRNAYHKGKINPKSSVYRIFAKYGWVWGGDWQGEIKDYQHFEKKSF